MSATAAAPARVLLVDDEAQLRDLLARILELEGYAVATAPDGRRALKLVAAEPVDVVVTDVMMPGMTGLELLAAVKRASPATEVICLTAYGKIDDGVEAMRRGAYDYLEKQHYRQRIIPLLAKAVERARLEREVRHLRAAVGRERGFEAIIGHSAAIRHARELAEQVAPTDAAVLLLGPTGSGKELFARAIHGASPRAARGQLVTINCAALPRDLLESELFGHRAGAFTGATAEKPGLFEVAHGGTLFLDEIGEMPAELQAKLLRVLEYGTFRRLGDTQERAVDVRVISATHRDLPAASSGGGGGAGGFREDLYYRLALFTLHVPGLADRPGDILPLAHHFAARACAKTGRTPPDFDEVFAEALRRQPWRGNVRELRNAIERACILQPAGPLTVDTLAPAYRTPASQVLPEGAPRTLAEWERVHINEALERTGGNKTLAAKQLGIGLRTLYDKLG